MIPKKIHYIWIGGKPLPELVEKCVASWKKFCPDYEIKRWDESNLDLDVCQYVREAYDAKKYAFVSDFFRYQVIYNEGGVYLDVDVELIKNIDDLLTNKLFMGFENEQVVNPGSIFGAEPKNEHIGKLLKDYEHEKFIYSDGSCNYRTICSRTTDYFLELGLKSNPKDVQAFYDITIFPKEYFSPLSPNKKKLKITDKTYAIHWYMASWMPNKNIFQKMCEGIKRVIMRLIGRKNAIKLKNMIGMNKK